MPRARSRAASAALKAPQAPKGGGFCVYLGPSILGVVQNGTIYPGTKEEVTARLAGAIAKRPLIEPLIVDSDSLAEDRIRVKTPGTLLYSQYCRLAGEIRR